MKLAEALSIRADLQTRVEQLRERLILNAKVQENEQPAEQPEELIAELDGCTARYEELVAAINLTNTLVKDESGASMTALIAKRDAITLRLSVLRQFAAEAGELVSRHTRSELVIRSTVDVRELQKRIDAESKALRELNVKLQGLNWTSELIESVK